MALFVIYFNNFYWFCYGRSVSEPYEDLKKKTGVSFVFVLFFILHNKNYVAGLCKEYFEDLLNPTLSSVM